MGKNFSCNNLGQRKKSDFYETHESMVQQLLDREKIEGTVLEPACGHGAITRVLSRITPLWSAYDIQMGTDFLDEKEQYDIVLTNPPYSLAFEFIQKAKEVAREKIIFLLPLSYLHGKKRYDTIWTDKKFPLARIYVFTRYPMLGVPLRHDGKYPTGMVVYCWMVWERGYKGDPFIKWIDNNQYVIGKGD